jgi:heme/copper-type cytochrome/quinol oxidase subunit 2
MESNGPIDALPLWGLFIAILVVVLVSVECGYRLGKYRRARHEQEKEAPVGTMVGATLGLLAFILAFTFGLAAARFDTRRQVLLDGANVAVVITCDSAAAICNNRILSISDGLVSRM